LSYAKKGGSYEKYLTVLRKVDRNIFYWWNWFGYSSTPFAK